MINSRSVVDFLKLEDHSSKSLKMVSKKFFKKHCLSLVVLNTALLFGSVSCTHANLGDAITPIGTLIDASWFITSYDQGPNTVSQVKFKGVSYTVDHYADDPFGSNVRLLHLDKPAVNVEILRRGRYPAEKFGSGEGFLTIDQTGARAWQKLQPSKFSTGTQEYILLENASLTDAEKTFAQSKSLLKHANTLLSGAGIFTIAGDDPSTANAGVLIGLKSGGNLKFNRPPLFLDSKLNNWIDNTIVKGALGIFDSPTTAHTFSTSSSSSGSSGTNNTSTTGQIGPVSPAPDGFTSDYQSSSLQTPYFPASVLNLQRHPEMYRYYKILTQSAQSNPLLLHRLNRVRGACIGLAIGDAMGITWENSTQGQSYQTRPRNWILNKVNQPNGIRNFLVYKGQEGQKNYGVHRPKFVKDLPGVIYKPGEWTDDTSQSLSLAHSILEKSQVPTVLSKSWIDTDDLMYKLYRWYSEPGYNTCPTPVAYLTRAKQNHDWIKPEAPGIGAGTAKRMEEYEQRFKSQGKNPQGLGTATPDPGNQGNGALMRVAPLAARWWNDRDTCTKNAVFQSMTTHNSVISEELCALLANIMLYGISDNRMTPQDIKESLWNDLGGYAGVFSAQDVSKNQQYWKVGEILGNSADWRTWTLHSLSINPNAIVNKAASIPYGSPYIIPTFKIALHSFFTGDTFDDVIGLAVAYDGDSDTIGAIAGQMAGAFHGFSNIPPQWFQGLYDHDKILAAADALFFASFNYHPSQNFINDLFEPGHAQKALATTGSSSSSTITSSSTNNNTSTASTGSHSTVTPLNVTPAAKTKGTLINPYWFLTTDQDPAPTSGSGLQIQGKPYAIAGYVDDASASHLRLVHLQTPVLDVSIPRLARSISSKFAQGEAFLALDQSGQAAWFKLKTESVTLGSQSHTIFELAVPTQAEKQLAEAQGLLKDLSTVSVGAGIFTIKDSASSIELGDLAGIRTGGQIKYPNPIIFFDEKLNNWMSNIIIGDALQSLKQASGS